VDILANVEENKGELTSSTIAKTSKKVSFMLPMLESLMIIVEVIVAKFCTILNGQLQKHFWVFKCFPSRC